MVYILSKQSWMLTCGCIYKLNWFAPIIRLLDRILKCEICEILSSRKFARLNNVIHDRSLTLFEKQLAYLIQTDGGSVLKLNSFFLLNKETISLIFTFLNHFSQENCSVPHWIWSTFACWQCHFSRSQGEG